MGPTGSVGIRTHQSLHESPEQLAQQIGLGTLQVLGQKCGQVITEHWTGEGKLYVCAIKDVYSNRIVGYSIDSRMKSRIAVTALDNAIARRRAEGAGLLHG